MSIFFAKKHKFFKKKLWVGCEKVNSVSHKKDIDFLLYTWFV